MRAERLGAFRGDLRRASLGRAGRRWVTVKEVAGGRTEAALASRMSSPAHSEAQGTLAFMRETSLDGARQTLMTVRAGWTHGSQAAGCLCLWLVGAEAGLWFPGALHGTHTDNTKEKGYLDNSGHRPAMRRMWLNDVGHLSAATGLSCRGRLLAVCPALAGCLLGSWQLMARGLHETGCLGSQPAAPPKPSSKDKGSKVERARAEGTGPGPSSRTPKVSSHPHPVGQKEPKAGRHRVLASVCNFPAL